MAKHNIDLSKYDSEFIGAAMKRVEASAKVIQAEAKTILSGKLKGDWKEHGPYKDGSSWTARHHGDMIKTIRVVRKEGKKNVLVIAGHYNTWWATQLEHGRGGWKGGAKPFMRPAMKNAEGAITTILEGGGAGETVL